MELLNHLALGLATALTLQNLAYCFAGTLIGTLIGVLPGLGPVATLAMLLPFTYTLEPTSALIMLAGIYYGAQYGGSTTAILVNLPGEASSVVTCLDGYQMARRGRAGAALGIAAIGSFVAGSFATLLIAAFALPLVELAFKFGPAEYFSLMVPRPDRRGGAGLRIADQGDRDDHPRTAARAGRHRRELGRGPLRLRRAGTHRRARLRRGGDGRVRLCRDRGQHREARQARGLHRQGDEPAADPRRSQASRAGDRARHRARIGARHPSRRRRAALGLRLVQHGEEDRRQERHAAVRSRATSAASPGRNRPTTPARRPRSSRC